MPSIATHLLLLGAFIASLALSFLIFFLGPSVRHWLRLRKIWKLLRSEPFAQERNPDQLAEVFKGDKHLSHQWAEYRKTLYDSLPTTSGIASTEWRSTIAAESIWNGELIVDSRVHADFFKHVPGIFTGLGIIGTFLGLIEGLSKFKVSNITQNGDVLTQQSAASLAQASLESLMHAVGEAFFISASAIICAMVATFLEKLMLNALYIKVDDIAGYLDAKFAAAAPEKFLEQTASYTEESATQLKQLKSELLKDLTPILYDLSERQAQMLERMAGTFQDRIAETAQRQIDASRDNSTEMAGTISGAIKDGLKGPLDEIKAAVTQASGDQSAGAIEMLQDVMTHFSQKLNDLFGGQITGINELNQRTAKTMEDAVLKLNELVGSLQDAGKSSTESMAEQMTKAITNMEARQAEITLATQALVGELKSAIEQGQTATASGIKSSSDEMARRMAEAVEKMEQRQESINQRTQEFVEQIKALVANTQTETSSQLQSTLNTLGEQLGMMLQNFQTVQQGVISANQQREQETAQQTQAAVGALADRSKEFVSEVESLLSQTQNQTKATMETTIQDLGSQVGAMLKEFREAQQVSLDSNLAREEYTSQKTQAVVNSMVSSVDSLVKQVADASARMQDSVSTLATVTKTTISGLTDGADQVNAASRNFNASSEKVVGAMNLASTVTTRLAELTSNVTAASATLQQGIQDYRSHREAMVSLVSDLNGLITNAKTDVSITSNVLQRIEQAAVKLSAAQFETERFMEGVGKVLAKSSADFQTSVTNSLNKANYEFQDKLSSAVRMLTTAIDEFEEALSNFSPQGAPA